MAKTTVTTDTTILSSAGAASAVRFHVDDAIRERVGIFLSQECHPASDLDHNSSYHNQQRQAHASSAANVDQGEQHRQQQVTKEVFVPVLVGNEPSNAHHSWIESFGRWAAQEGLSEDLALIFATEYTERMDYAWAQQFHLGHSWEDFVRCFFQRIIPSDILVNQEVERYMGWYRREYRFCRKRACDAIKFSQRELARATGQFTEHNIIGHGSFGVVYRGHLPKYHNRGPVAVKRLRLVSPQVLSAINQDVNNIISRCRHSHLLNLIGSSLSLKDPILVYEFVPNGNLREHLDGLRGLKLNWGTRIKVAIETAQALTYLHSSTTNVIHGDVKSKNILLDEYFSAKLADFGISKTLCMDHGYLMTSLPNSMGSPGYLDPHFLQNYNLSAKSDVYSFGVVLLELVSGMPVVDLRRPRNKLTLTALAVSRAKAHRLSELFDPYLIQTGVSSDFKQWQRVTLLAMQCIRMDPEARPTVKELLDTLRQIRPSSSSSYSAAVAGGPLMPYSPRWAMASQGGGGRRALNVLINPVGEASMKFLAWGNRQVHRNLLIPGKARNVSESEDQSGPAWLKHESTSFASTVMC